MPSEVKEIGPCKYLLKIEVPPEKIKEKLEIQYQDFIKESVIPGFRKGKAPRHLVERRFSKEIAEKAKLDLISDSYETVLKEQNLSPIAEPNLELDKILFEQNKPLSFEVTIEVTPKITIKKYGGINIKRIKPEVTEKDTDEALARLRDSKAELIPVKDAVIAQDDYLTVDEEILAVSDKPGINNQKIAKQENVTIKVDPAQTKPELVKDLVGARIGDTREMQTTLPNDYPRKEWRGAAARAKITIKEIKRRKLPEVNEAWAKELNFNSLNHLKEELKKRLLQSKVKESEHLMEDQIIEEIIKESDFVLPETLVKHGVDNFLNRQKISLYLAGYPENQIASQIEERRVGAQEIAIKMIKKELIIEHVAEKEKIFVTEDEINKFINERAKTTGRWPNEIRTYYERNNLMGSLRSELKEEKVRKLLREQAVITD